MADGVAAAKSALRRRLLATRQARTPRPEATAALAERVLALPEAAGVTTVACYLELAGEPPTSALVTALHARGVRVLVPLLLPGGDLDWAELDQVPAREGTGRHTGVGFGVGLGVDAVAEAGLVVVPGLAAGADLLRLGRGGGSYDRALARATGVSVLLLWEEELLPDVPREPHDRAVDVVVTPTGVLRRGP